MARADQFELPTRQRWPRPRLTKGSRNRQTRLSSQFTGVKSILDARRHRSSSIDRSLSPLRGRTPGTRPSTRRLHHCAARCSNGGPPRKTGRGDDDTERRHRPHEHARTWATCRHEETARIPATHSYAHHNKERPQESARAVVSYATIATARDEVGSAAQSARPSSRNWRHRQPSSTTPRAPSASQFDVASTRAA